MSSEYTNPAATLAVMLACGTWEPPAVRQPELDLRRPKGRRTYELTGTEDGWRPLRLKRTLQLTAVR